MSNWRQVKRRGGSVLFCARCRRGMLEPSWTLVPSSDRVLTADLTTSLPDFVGGLSMASLSGGYGRLSKAKTSSASMKRYNSRSLPWTANGSSRNGLSTGQQFPLQPQLGKTTSPGLRMDEGCRLSVDFVDGLCPPGKLGVLRSSAPSGPWMSPQQMGPATVASDER